MELPLQTKDLAATLGVPRRIIVDWAVAGLLPTLNPNVGRGNSHLYSQDAVERWRLLCRLNRAGIGIRDVRKLLPVIERALQDEFVLNVPLPIKAGNRLYTLCQMPRQGLVLVDGVPPGQTVIPLLALDVMSETERKRASENK